MGQYELAKEIHAHHGAVTLEELVRKTGLSKGAVDDQIRKLEKKEYIENTKEGYVSNMSEQELGDLKPFTIEELKSDKSEQ
jgi:predicted transcriptional regulator